MVPKVFEPLRFYCIRQITHSPKLLSSLYMRTPHGITAINTDLEIYCRLHDTQVCYSLAISILFEIVMKNIKENQVFFMLIKRQIEKCQIKPFFLFFLKRNVSAGANSFFE